MAFQISVNGRSASWGHITVKILPGQEVTGLTAATFSDQLEESKESGTGLAHKPTRRSAGKYTVGDCSLTGFASDIQAVCDLVASLPQGRGRSFGASEFDVLISVAYMDFEPVRQVQLHKCRIMGVSESYQEGPELLKTDLTISPMYISRNGLTLFDGPLIPGR